MGPQHAEEIEPTKKLIVESLKNNIKINKKMQTIMDKREKQDEKQAREDEVVTNKTKTKKQEK
jgi:hypothetical protein